MVLEVGTGSGYQAAVLAEIVAQVYSIEIIESLGKEAAERLENARLRATSKSGSATATRAGRRRRRSTRIVVTAAAPRVPQALVDQLKPGGRMVIPVGASHEAQELLLVVKRPDGSVEKKSVLPVRFVPLVPGK